MGIRDYDGDFRSSQPHFPRKELNFSQDRKKERKKERNMMGLLVTVKGPLTLEIYRGTIKTHFIISLQFIKS